ncbi:MAG: cytochrome P450 [Novosphingobium sp.]|nr:cytochrome P450 [Novosphingobium sp.]MCP5403016.1 cytochrome P450 [Novosphingobium sp.]
MNAQSPIGFSYDPYARDVLKNPLPYYRELLENHPGYYVEKYDMFVFTRFQDIIDVAGVTDDNTFVGSESTLPMPAAITHKNDGPPPFVSTNPMSAGIMLPSPEYEEMRLAHIKPLRPKAVAAIQDMVRDLVLGRLRELLPRGRFEVMGEFCGLVSAAVTCHLFGIPKSEAQGVLDAVNALAVYSDDKVGVDTPGMYDQLKAHIRPAIERRRKAGADGEVALIDGLINHRVKSDGRALTDDEIADQLVCSFVAATETPPKPTSQGLWMLWQNPDQLAEVRKDLDANIPIVTEEILRLCITNQFAIRTAHKDVSVAGVDIKAGQRVLLGIYAGLRDPREFDDPEKFIWNRKINRVLTFGYGQHHCIGNNLARMQVRTMLRAFLEHVEEFEFDMDKAVHAASYFHWGWIKLPVVVGKYSI